MHGRLRTALVAALSVLLATTTAAYAAAPAKPAPRPTVVVAVADTGVNPYHEAFYRPENTAHPCTWVAGFTDCSLPALELSVGRFDSVEEAFEADAEIWASVEQHQWYWIPRTNIIGAVCDTVVGGGATSTALPPLGPVACIFDENGHGTGTASAVLSEAPESLLLVHEGNSGANDMPTAPVTPDVQSHSWGFAAPLPLQVARPLLDEPCPVGEAGPETLAFLAAGNETPWPTLLDCMKAEPGVQVVGGGYPGYWQADSWTVYDFASWYCRPTAEATSTSEYGRHCGTSFSAPTAAGVAAAALLEVRRHDRYSGRSTAERVSRSVPRAQFVEALRNGASYTPENQFPDSTPCLDPAAACFGVRSAGVLPVPAQAPYLVWGYGWLDKTVTAAVVSCALGRACPEKSAESQAYNDQRQQARTVTSLQALGTPPGDDAGSGRDAGEDPASAVRIVPKVSYDAALAGTTDWGDGYAVRARAGQRLTVTSTTDPAQAGLLGCWSVFGPEGERLTPTSTGNVTACDPGTPPTTDLVLPDSGTYTVVYESYVAQSYRFSMALT